MVAIKEEYITGNDFRRMLQGAYSAFLLEHEKINELNVFPVPDGDTGTNMLHTLAAVARAVTEAGENSVGSLARKAADSAIMGARGNSGVILSQIIRGIGRGLAGKEEVTSSELGKAFQYGILYAYRAVARPVEGTILTVAKGIAKGAYHAVRSKLPVTDILQQAIKAGEIELNRTPELLPALKAAGVVDAGGKGLLVFLQGCLQGLGGEFVLDNTPLKVYWQSSKTRETATVDFVHPYCTEFIVKGARIAAKEVEKILEELGESLVVAAGETILKIHIHTGRPGQVLERALGWGTLHDIKIDNMADQHNSKFSMDKEPAAPEKMPLTVIAVAAGAGLAEIMRGMGAAIIVAGGQSMNPSVEDFMDAVHGGLAERYIILPNNRNITLAAYQAQKLSADKVKVVPAVNTPQGLAALTAFDGSADWDVNVAKMTAALAEVREAGITIAVRDSMVDGVAVRAGDFIGVVDGKVKITGGALPDVLLATVRYIAADDSELVSLFYGRPVDDALAGDCAAHLRQALPDVQVEVYDGGQPLYHFIIGVE